jgi:hypothetical protein
VLQVINHHIDQPFGALEEDGARQFCQTLASRFASASSGGTAT